MLREVDTREVGGQTVALYIDGSDTAHPYFVAVEGYGSIPCTTKEDALRAYRHPFAYLPPVSTMPLEGHRSDSDAMEGSSHTSEPFQGITEQTAAVLIDLKDVLSAMDDSDFRWTVSILSDVVSELSRERGCNRPYAAPDDPDIPFA